MATKICEGKISKAARRSSCSKKRRGKLEVEVDELWSFVMKKQ
jgi:hypothetical protein